ncbi:hypothetical protein [Nocardia pneumoniae]|uniref:hypothetical protein n=1 Tax=Nocardia pneumoniae TaxID=228601 RepID=UPI0002F7C6A2|nr:hypothetical protein [Nocardia pneumoniae]
MGDYDWHYIAMNALAGGVGGGVGEIIGAKAMTGIDRLGKKAGRDLASSTWGRGAIRLGGAAVGGVAGGVAGAGILIPFTGEFDFGWDAVVPGLVGGALGAIVPAVQRGPAAPIMVAPQAPTGAPPLHIRREPADRGPADGQSADGAPANAGPPIDVEPAGDGNAHPPERGPDDEIPADAEGEVGRQHPSPDSRTTEHSSAQTDRTDARSPDHPKRAQPDEDGAAGDGETESSAGRDPRHQKEPDNTRTDDTSDAARLKPDTDHDGNGTRPRAGEHGERPPRDAGDPPEQLGRPPSVPEPSADTGLQESRPITPFVGVAAPAADGTPPSADIAAGKSLVADGGPVAQAYQDRSQTRLAQTARDYEQQRSQGNDDGGKPATLKWGELELAVTEVAVEKIRMYRWDLTSPQDLKNAFAMAAASRLAKAVGMPNAKYFDVYISKDAVYMMTSQVRKVKDVSGMTAEGALNHLKTNKYPSDKLEDLKKGIKEVGPELRQLGYEKLFDEVEVALAGVKARTGEGTPEHEGPPNPNRHQMPADRTDHLNPNERLPGTHGEHLKPMTDWLGEPGEALDTRWRNGTRNPIGSYDAEYDSAEYWEDGVNPVRAQRDVIIAAIESGRPAAIEVVGPYMVDYYSDGNMVDYSDGIKIENLIKADRAVLESTAAMVKYLRGNYRDADIRIVALWDDYNLQNPGTGNTREQPFDDNDVAQFEKDFKKILSDMGLLGDKYSLFQESKLVAKAEELIAELENRGPDKGGPDKRKLEAFRKDLSDVREELEGVDAKYRDDPNSKIRQREKKIEEAIRMEEGRRLIRREGKEVFYVNYRPENARHFTFSLKKADGTFTCEALDFAKVVTLLEQLKNDTKAKGDPVMVVTLGSHLRPQQDNLWELLRSYGVRPDQYHNYFLDPEAPRDAQVEYLLKDLGKVAALVLVFSTSIAALTLDREDERETPVMVA